ncbi:unnamed protein product [Diplocarpon coronariae]
MPTLPWPRRVRNSWGEGKGGGRAGTRAGEAEGNSTGRPRRRAEGGKRGDESDGRHTGTESAASRVRSRQRRRRRGEVKEEDSITRPWDEGTPDQHGRISPARSLWHVYMVYCVAEDWRHDVERASDTYIRLQHPRVRSRVGDLNVPPPPPPPPPAGAVLCGALDPAATPRPIPKTEASLPVAARRH